MNVAPDERGGGKVGYGPGVSWLAEQTGRPPGELLADPAGLVAAAASAARTCAEIAAGVVSGDPATRADAERRRALLLTRFDSAPAPGETFGARVAAALRDATARVRDAGSAQDGPPNRGDQR